MLRRIAVGPLLGVLCLTSCATVDEFRALEREVVELKRVRSQPTNQQERVAELGAQLGELRSEVDRLRGVVEELEFAIQQLRAGAPGAIGSGLLPGDVSPPGGETGDPEPYGDPSPGASDEPLPSSNGAPLPGGEPLVPDGASGGGGTQAASPGARPPAPAAIRGIGAEVASYEEAFRLYRAGSYDLAVAGFRDFLKLYPSSDYADNALFWLGECYFKQGDHASAAVAFEDVARKYPDGNKVPDALYRQGIALLEIGQASGEPAKFRGAAREIFAKLVERYPDSARAEEARRQLEKLGT
jgi:tol-pal system protein YbgF